MSDDVQRSLGRLEGKLDSLAEQFTELVEAVATSGHRTDTRVRSLENKQHWYAGAASVIGSAIGLFTGHSIKF